MCEKEARLQKAIKYCNEHKKEKAFRKDLDDG
jgi:hypothetical protein